MDISIPNLTASDVVCTASGFEFVNSTTRAVIFKLLRETSECEYHAVIRAGNGVEEVLRIESTFDYNTQNVISIRTALNKALGMMDYTVLALGVYYTHDNAHYVNNYRLETVHA